MRPWFIVMDGVEGCGKSTQVRLVSDLLRTQGHELTVTHEPGGTAVGERIRELLLDPTYPEMSSLTEVMLFCASRAQHCEQVIRPALQAGHTVLCDRFASATAAYQGYAGGLGVDLVRDVNRVATGGLAPDLLVILDLDPEIGLRRKFGHEAVAGDRIEEKSMEFHRLVREGFLAYARAHERTAVVVDADAEPEQVHEAIVGAMQQMLIDR